MAVLSPVSEALQPAGIDVSGTGIHPVHGIAGYLKRTESLDGARQAFDESTLKFSDRRETAIENYHRVSKRARDLTMVAGLILGLAAASRLSGEDFSALAWSIVTLVPALICCAKSWRASEQLKLVDLEAGYVAGELELVEARRLWLRRAARLVPVLERATGADPSEANECAKAMRKAVEADRKIDARHGYSETDLLPGGWGVPGGGWGVWTDLFRRSLTAAVIAGALNSVVLGAAGHAQLAIAFGAATSVFAVIRLLVSARFVQNRASVVTSVSVWNKQLELFKSLDAVIRARAEVLIARYREAVVIDLR